MQEISSRSVNGIAEFQVPFDSIPAKVKVPVFHPNIIATIGVILNGKRRNGRFVQNSECSDFNLNLTRWNGQVLVASLNHIALGLQYKFPAQGIFIQLLVETFIENQLGDAVAIAKVNKGNGTEFPDGLHPSSQGYG